MIVKLGLQTSGYRIPVIILPCQGRDTGSIPVTRSKNIVDRIFYMTEVNVRDANVNDAEGIATVHVKMWQQAYRGQIPDSFLDSMSVEDRTEGWKKELEHPYENTFAYVADIDNVVAGWVTGGVNRDSDLHETSIAELYGIYVLPGYTNLGIGSKLMEKLFQNLKDSGYKQATLWVLDTNEKTRKWYESKGWRIEGKTKSEKRDGFDLNEVRYIRDL